MHELAETLDHKYLRDHTVASSLKIYISNDAGTAWTRDFPNVRIGPEEGCNEASRMTDIEDLIDESSIDL